MMDQTARLVMKYSFGILLVLLGLVLKLLGVGRNAFLGFGSVADYLLYVGVLAVIIVTLSSYISGKRIVDERMVAVSSKASGITFVVLVMACFVIMIIDGIRPITVPYSMFMGYPVCGIVLVHLISYKVLLRYN
jgi:uncharacterized membrane protein